MLGQPLLELREDGAQPQQGDAFDLAAGDAEFAIAGISEAGVHGGEDHRLGVVADGDDEGEAEFGHVGGVELGELAAFVVGEGIEAGGGLLGARGFGEALGGCELSRQIGMGGEDAEALLFGCCPKLCAKREVKAGGGIVDWAEFAVEGAFGDPLRMLEDRAEMADGTSPGCW